VVTSVALNGVIWFFASVDAPDRYIDRTHDDTAEVVWRALSQVTLTEPVPQLASLFAVTLTALLGMAILAHRGGGTWTLILVAVVCINAVAAAMTVMTDAVNQLTLAASILSVASVIATLLTAALLLWWPSESPQVSGPAEPDVSAARPAAVTQAFWLLVAGVVLSWLFAFDPNPAWVTYHDLFHPLFEPLTRWSSVAGLVIAFVVLRIAMLGLVALALARMRAGRWWARTLLALLSLFTIVELTKAAFQVLAPQPGAPTPGFGFAAGVLGRGLILIAVVSLFWPTTTSYFDSRIDSDAAGRR